MESRRKDIVMDKYEAMRDSLMQCTRGIVIDCFAGGGGASQGIEDALHRPCDIAVNHDPKAIAMHKANHPATYHMTEDIFEADLERVVDGRHVGLMWASPDCTSHSRAKGGTPRKSGLRILPWAVHKHAKAVSPDVIIMENVAEIQKWGPLDSQDRPIKSREGEEYRRFVDAMGELGYEFQCRELTAADFGAPTSRRRWYAVLRRDGGRIRWPDQTHGDHDLFHEQWVPASSCIDFADTGESVFDRGRPLAEATRKRITRGIEKFVLKSPDIVDGKAAFITKFYHTGTGQRVSEPLHTITTSQGHFGLVTAFLVSYYGNGQPISVDKPLPTITTRDRFGLVTVEVDGATFAICDIRLRMLHPEELKLAQGFPRDYIIDRYADGSKVPSKQQVKMIGNSVVPVMARRLVEVNVA